MAFSETTTRVIVAAIGIPVALAVIYVGGWPLTALLALIAVLVALEFFRLVEKKGPRPMPVLGGGVAGLFIVLAGLDPSRGPEGGGFATLLVLSLLSASVLAIWTRGVAGNPTLATSATVAGAAYSGALLSFGLFLRHLPGHADALHGTALVLAPLLLTWASDTFAYFVGRQWGTRKLIPAVSPGKTLQGAIGAVAGTVLVAIGYALVLQRFPTYRMGLVEAAAFGLLISIAAQVGDLAESLFKRDAGVKDSGTLLPGHGGALDRFDSLLFTLPIGYFFLRYFVGPGGVS